ncbi:MAG: helix-turn-helix domain-containing protein [Spirochaetaceae bacterium]|nr:helix-turn-helix domain-containing protein [Spirochaetaceae bacterium]
MFSVLIVDDEEPVLDSYEFMLRSYEEMDSGSPFTLAGKARTGYEALKLIYEAEPDLVFMDINIPGIDGLSVLEDVYRKYPRMVCILSTAYERFDLAQRAIPLGVFAYLVKPVSKKTFFETLEQALAQLRSRPRERFEYYNDSLQRLMRKDIWVEMSEETWSRYREQLGLPSDYGIILHVELEKDLEIWQLRIAEQLSYKHHCIHDSMLNRCMFLVSEDLNPAVFRQRTEKMLKETLVSLDWYCGIGGLYRGPELYHSCNEALTELAAKRKDTGGHIRRRIALLRQKIGLVPAEEAKALFAAVWEPLFSEDFQAAKLKMVSLFTLLLDDIFGVWSKDSAETFDAPLPMDPAEIMGLTGLGAWKHWAELNFDRLVLQANLDRSGNYPLPLVRALAFIRENYARGIQLSDAAEAARVSPAHLSRLFAEHLKTNFVDYVTALRINEAERLFKESLITVKEAAYAVGYQDPNYFSKTFKKIKGVLPTELKQ